MVRVAIAQEVSSVRVTVLASCQLTDLKSGAVMARSPRMLWQRMEPIESGLKIGTISTRSAAILLEPADGAFVWINARPYRDSLIFYRTPSGKLTVINRLDLEEYLVGAVGSEVGRNWPVEALKAQAIVSRTMVAHRIWTRKGAPFDVTADTQTHLYRGAALERSETKTAVEQTKGQVLAYRGELLPVTFHASCGGHTEDAAELWDVAKDLVPFKGKVDPYCRGQKHFRWEMEISVRDFTKTLGPLAGEIGDLVSFETGERNPSGRVRFVRLKGSRTTATVPSRKLREMLGPNRLRSLNFTAHLSPDGIFFSGFGWGHGVGLCQWGAFAMAHKGHTMDEILQFYFPGAQRRALKGLPGFPTGS